ncbi:MAG: hypothetical protein ACFCVA_18855 [Gammaproteobacteria bacterium]
MERCPNCRARYTGSEQCHRCGMELTQLLHIEAQAVFWEGVAVRRLAAGDVTGAKAAATQALLKQRRPLALTLGSFLRDTSPFWEAAYGGFRVVKNPWRAPG